jgi:hypothetical protein
MSEKDSKLEEKKKGNTQNWKKKKKEIYLVLKYINPI